MSIVNEVLSSETLLSNHISASAIEFTKEVDRDILDHIRNAYEATDAYKQALSRALNVRTDEYPLGLQHRLESRFFNKLSSYPQEATDNLLERALYYASDIFSLKKNEEIVRLCALEEIEFTGTSSNIGALLDILEAVHMDTESRDKRQNKIKFTMKF